MKKAKRLSAKTARRKGLVTGKDVASNIFSGLDSKKPQQFGRTFGRAVRQPNRRTGR